MRVHFARVDRAAFAHELQERLRARFARRRPAADVRARGCISAWTALVTNP